MCFQIGLEVLVRTGGNIGELEHELVWMLQHNEGNMYLPGRSRLNKRGESFSI